MQNEDMTVEQMFIELKTRFDQMTELLMMKLDAGIANVEESPTPILDLSDPLDDQQKPTYAELLKAYRDEVTLSQSAVSYINQLTVPMISNAAEEDTSALYDEFAANYSFVVASHSVVRTFAMFSQQNKIK